METAKRAKVNLEFRLVKAAVKRRGAMNHISRREFLFGAAAFGFSGWRVFAAPPGWKSSRRPRLVFGVLADTHFRTDVEWRRGIKSDRVFTAALEYFRDVNVDAVVHCGDMADRGLVEELQLHADAWSRVFPGNRARDGHIVGKLFVTGNHDYESWHKDFDFHQFVPDESQWPEKVLNLDIARHWERIWGEKYEPVWHKSVKGFNFFGKNWEASEESLRELIDDKSSSCGLETGTMPFFFITHDWTHGRFKSAIKRYGNAFGLWGHWHQSAANWGTIKMLTPVTPGVQCPACPAWWRPDGKYMGGGDAGIVKVPLEGKLAGGKWCQGLVVRVYDDMLTIERREFSGGGSLGADWVMPFGKSPHPFSKEKLEKAIGKPQFAKSAKVKVESAKLESGEDAVRVSIPLADGNPDSRVYAYEVVVAGEGVKLRKAVYAAGCNMGIGHETNGGVTTLEIAKDELPPGKTLTFAVRPLTSLGTSGKAIATEFKV